MNQDLAAKINNNPPQIPNGILIAINAKFVASTPQTPGYQRGKGMLKNRTLSYESLKRLKNFFDYCDPATQKDEFDFAGGQAMRNFVEQTLQSGREQSKIADQNRVVSAAPSAMDNTLHGSSGDVNMDLSEAQVKDKKPRGALAVIVNEDNKVLIVKRAPFKGSWMPNKFALVGGGIEKGEEPIDTAKREAIEESGLTLDHFIDSFNIISPPNIVDYVFIAKAPKNQEVKLNEEHTEFKWVSLNEIAKLDSVPMLAECIELALNKLKEKGIYKK